MTNKIGIALAQISLGTLLTLGIFIHTLREAQDLWRIVLAGTCFMVFAGFTLAVVYQAWVKA